MGEKRRPDAGKRWTATPAARALVQTTQEDVVVKEVPAPQAPVTIAVSGEPQQLAPFTNLPRNPLPFEDGAEIPEIWL